MAYFALTAQVDTFQGGAGDDIFELIGNSEKLSGTDRLIGGEGVDTLTFGNATVSLAASRLAGLSSVERLDFTRATASISVQLDAASIAQSEGRSLTLATAANAILLDTSLVADAGTVVLAGTGLVTLRNFENQAITVANGYNGYVQGGTARDRIVGGTGNDWFDGGAGDDDLLGGAGADNLKGAAGEDVVDSGGGNDTLDGGAGHDVLIAGAGSSQATGGTGSDTFVVKAGAQLTVTDFDASDPEERIDLRALPAIASFAALTITQSGSDSVVAGAGLNLRLRNVQATSLDDRSFVFAGSPFVTVAQSLTADPFYRLTAAADVRTGTAGSDVFELIGSSANLAGTDILNGAGGIDTLRIKNTTVSLADAHLAGMTSIERIDISYATGSASVSIGAGTVQRAGGVVTLAHGAADVLLDVSQVGPGGSTIVSGSGSPDDTNASLKNAEGRSPEDALKSRRAASIITGAPQA